ncbi:MAG: hypothetical protein ACNA7L_10915 [Roseinatronobacter sp.]
MTRDTDDNATARPKPAAFARRYARHAPSQMQTCVAPRSVLQCRNILRVNTLGKTGSHIAGAAAVRRLMDQMRGAHPMIVTRNFFRFRIDLLERFETDCRNSAGSF